MDKKNPPKKPYGSNLHPEVKYGAWEWKPISRINALICQTISDSNPKPAIITILFLWYSGNEWKPHILSWEYSQG